MGGKTSPEAVQRWEKRNYKKFLVRFRFDTDKRLLDFIEDYKDEIGTTQIFREALILYIKEKYPDYGRKE